MTHVLDISAWADQLDYDECLKLCQDLGLVEVVWHGDDDYGRLTEKGTKAYYAMTKLMGHGIDPRNVLKVT